MAGKPSSRSWNCSIRFDSEHQCLVLVFERCCMRSAQDVDAFYAQLHTRTRTFYLKSDLIVDYGGLQVAREAVSAFLAGRDVWCRNFTGRIYRIASPTSDFARPPLSTLPTSELAGYFASLDDVLRQLRADRRTDRAG
jgi:hypothetical protein